MKERKEMLTRKQKLAIYIVENKATIRQTAEVFGISKTTVHEVVTARLMNSSERFINGIDLYEEVRKVLAYNFEQKATRGGKARHKNNKK